MTESIVNDNDILPGCSTFDDFLQEAYPMIARGIKASNALPNRQKYNYYKTYPAFEPAMKHAGGYVQSTLQHLLQYTGFSGRLVEKLDEEKFDPVVDANDKLLDRATKSMYILDGTRFNPLEDYGEADTTVKKISTTWNRNNLIQQLSKDQTVKLCTQKKTIRPQIFFKDKIDNRNVPWIPTIKEKPNSFKQLSILPTINELGQHCYTHPYEYELTLWNPDESRLQMIDDIQPSKPLDETSLIFVSTETQLKNMIEDLLKQKEIAVDLEHHSFRSFMGFTCLLQISTRDSDYIVDTLVLRHELYTLNEVFTNSSILKIFHGSSCDIEWLQRDLSVYVVNMFDTQQAAKVLDYPKLSLAYLLKTLCNIDTNKKYQLYDWRIRPLPPRAIEYARQDTHYLIYIFEKLNNDLITKAMGKSNQLKAVYDQSCDLCKKVYIKPLLDENSHMNLYRRMNRPLDNQQLFAFKEIYKWRDTVARLEDESPSYVLPNHMLMQICQTLPRELQGILACCNPIPPLVRQHALELHTIIVKAKKVPLVKSLPEESRKDVQFSASRDLDLEARLSHFTHDNSGLEYTDDLPTLLSGHLKIDYDEPPLIEPKLSIIALKQENEKLSNVKPVTFEPPYNRYKKVLPYSIQQEKERIEQDRKREEDLAQRRNQMVKPLFNDSLIINLQQNMMVESTKRKVIDKQENDDAKKIKLNVDVKEEKIESFLKQVREENEVGVTGGDISLTRPRNNNNRQSFKPYDYNKVDFNKFGSGPSRINLHDGKPQRGNKRKKQFQGRNNGKRKGPKW